MFLTLAAYGVRVIGAESSIAYLEDARLIQQSMEIGQRLLNVRDFDTLARDPDHFKYPLTLTYVLTGVYGGLFAVGRILGVFESVAAFQMFLFANRDFIHILAVLVFNLISVLLIPVIFFTQGCLNVKHRGWLAAGLASFNLLLVHFGHQPRPHVPLATLSFCATVLLVMVAYRVGRGRIMITATVVSALTVGTLQSGLVIVVPFVLALLVRPFYEGRYHWRQLIGLQTIANVALFAGLCTFLYPGLITEYGTVIVNYLNGSATEFLLGGGSHDFSIAMFGTANIPQFVSRLRSYQPLLTILLPLALVYFVFSLRHRKRLLLVGLPFPLLNLAIWSLFYGTFPRITSVLVPFMVFVVAYMVEDAVCWIAQRWNLPVRRLRLFIFGLILMPLVVSSLRLVWITAQQDTRSLMTNWINENIPEGESILLNFQLLDLLPTQDVIERQGKDYSGSVGAMWQWLATRDNFEEPRYNIYNTMYWNSLDRTLSAKDDFIAEEGINYMVVRTLVAHPTVDEMIAYAQTHGKLIHTSCPAYDVDVAELPSDMFAEAWQQIWTISHPGPYVAIYDLNQTVDVPIVDVYCESIPSGTRSKP